MSFANKIRNERDYPGLRLVEGKPYEGVDAVFFTRQGGISTDEINEKGELVGAYAGLNVGVATKDSVENISENIARAAGYVGVTPENISAVNQDVYLETNGFFSARRQQHNLSKEALEEKYPGSQITTLLRHSHIGRNLTLVRLLDHVMPGKVAEKAGR